MELSQYPILSHPLLSYPILSHPIASHPIPSCPILSCPILHSPLLSSPVLSYPLLSYPIPSHPLLSYPLNPILSHCVALHTHLRLYLSFIILLVQYRSYSFFNAYHQRQCGRFFYYYLECPYPEIQQRKQQRSAAYTQMGLKMRQRQDLMTQQKRQNQKKDIFVSILQVCLILFSLCVQLAVVRSIPHLLSPNQILSFNIQKDE